MIEKYKLYQYIKTEQLQEHIRLVYGKYTDFFQEKMIYFEEYTDHSIKHIEAVISTAENLIPEKTLFKLSDMDLFTLLLAILYHDLAMHITVEGFQTLLNSREVICEIDGKTLYSYAQEFIEEISKYTDEEYKNRIGYHQGARVTSITEMPEDINLSREFIRRHHHRIAHYIAIKGFPAAQNEWICCEQKIYTIYHELAGFIARSHGMNLRETFKYLEEEYYEDWKTPRNVYAIYLMIILRISDYLHITNDRVNPYRLRLSNFKSKRSEIEHKKHLCTYESHSQYDSPQILYITCEPDELTLFIEMNNLLDDIQKELDISWAVLGEVYGKSDFDICIRRIHSNIKTNKWLEKQKFVPEIVHFNIDPKVMSLLIAPLYGSNPSFGIRELLQNATDACRQRVVYDKEYEPIVNIKFEIDTENDENYIVIQDNGIGMNLKIIREYFLRIGKPYTESDEWNNVRDKDSEVIKNGRFGVGILSSFLLGDKISVKTRRYPVNIDEKSKVLKFSTGLYDEYINIIKEDAKDFYGTEIRIKINKNTKWAINNHTLIASEWYKGNDIKIKIHPNILAHNNGGKNIEDTNEDDNKVNLDDEIIWNTINQDYFDCVKWSNLYYINPIRWQNNWQEVEKNNPDITDITPNLIYNGIVIPDQYNVNYSGLLIEKWPTIYIKDKQSKLDLNLSRSRINSTLPFIETLVSDLYSYYIFQLLQFEMKAKDGQYQTIFKVNDFKNQEIVFTRNGFSLLNTYFIKKIHPKHIFVIYCTNSSLDYTLLQDDTIVIFRKVYKYKSNFKSELLNAGTISEELNYHFISTAYSILIDTSIFNTHMDPYTSNSIKFRQEHRDDFSRRKEDLSNNFTLIKSSYISQNEDKVRNVIDSLNLNSENIKMIVYYKVKEVYSQNDSLTDSIFSNHLEDKYTLNYDDSERLQEFENVFMKLSEKFGEIEKNN